MNETAVHCQELNKSFGSNHIVKNCSIAVESGSILALLGPSGCGKTTTLRLIAGFEQLDQGRVEIGGMVVADGRFHLPPEKRRVGMVFQDYAIFPHLSVAQNIAFGLGRGAKAKAQLEAALALVGLEELAQQMPHELSGGQQQRVALARALAPEPAALLLDEPFSNLDTALRVQVRREVRGLLKESRTTAVFVTHDQEEAMFIGDRIAVMNNGVLEQVGTPQEIFHRPQSRFVAEFMGYTDFIPGVVTSAGVETVLGAFSVTGLPASGTAVAVCVRPDDVTLTENPDGHGRIVERRFVGMAYIYTIALEDGSLLRSWQFHTTNLLPGTAVSVAVRPGHRLNFFAGERAIGR
jgi:iron(III) transport system ATP-binding protein